MYSVIHWALVTLADPLRHFQRVISSTAGSMSEIGILQQSMAGYVSTTAFKAFRQL
jgi:hypothetical protein